MALATLRRGGVALVAGLLVAGSLGWAPRADAHPTAACTAGDGITVVVDFGSLGGGVQIRCVTQTVTSGFDALEKAGFAYEPTARFGGLLCRIDGKPSDDPCISAPPGDRYWAYWTAPAPGGTWSYSDQGAGNRVPPKGSVEGWAFAEGCDRKPGGACPSAVTTTTTARATTTTAAPSGAGAGASGTTSTTTTGRGGAVGGSTTTTAPARTTATAPSDDAPVAGEAGDHEDLALGGEAASAVDGSQPDDASGSPTGVLVVVLVVLGLGGAALLTARRRRADDGGPS